MKRDGSKKLFAVVLFVTLGLFILNPAFAGSDCNRVCEGSFVIDDIESAVDLEALSRCTSVTGDLSIIDTPLTSLKRLECLAHVGGRLVISINRSLKSLEGLNKLESVGGDLEISYNFSLTSLAGLNNLKSVGGDLAIWYNRELCTSLADALRDRLLGSGGTGRSIKVSINKPGC